MSELKTYVCPNCGANITNTQNCEYCGSLLVRFVEKDIDLSSTTYTSNEFVFPGLIAELQKNLRYQDEEERDIITNIHTQKDYDHTLDGYCFSICRSGYACWDGDHKMNLNNEKKGLVIDLSFEIYDCNSQFDQKELHKRFEQLTTAPLFTQRITSHTDSEGYTCKVIEYAIDFGTDAEGAARLISEILNKVYEIDLSEPMMYETEGEETYIGQVEGDTGNTSTGFSADGDNYYQENTANQINEEEEEPTWKKVLYVIGLILFVLKLLSMIF